MKEGFDISKIKIKSAKEPSLERKLTDEVITSLDHNAELPANAELEDKEFVRFPDGTIQMVVGNTHKKEGVKMHIPDGTQILSNSDKMKIGKDTASELQEEYGVKLSAKDTYASAMRKFDKHNGMTRLNDEQEELFKEVKRQQAKEMPEETAAINNQYLSEKINQIEKDKKSKEEIRNRFFKSAFDGQEASKPKKMKNKGDNFAFGGVSDKNLEALRKKHGISKSDLDNLLKGELPKYEGGGESDEIKELAKKYKSLKEVDAALKAGDITTEQANQLETVVGNRPPVTRFTTNQGDNTYSERVREKQKRGTAAFGDITEEDIPNVLENLYRNFPDIVAGEDVFGVKFNENGTISYNDGLDFSKKLDQVKRFQEQAKGRMEATADVILNNPDSFSDGQVEAAQSFRDNETFDDSLARGLDSKLGQFTSGRFNLGIDVVTPEERKALESKGIFTVNQLNDALVDNPDLIGDDSKNKLDNISELMTDNSDFTLNTYKTPETPEAKPAPEKTPEGTPIVDDIRFDIEQPRFGFASGYPNQRPLPPSPMEAHMLAQTRLGRIDPVRIGIEDKIQASHDRLNFTAEQIAHLPPQQQAIVMANAQANESKGLNDAIIKTNVVNMQNMASAELFNIGQHDREQFATNQNKLSFEERQLTAKAKTEEEFRNYFKELKRQRAERYRWDQNQSLLQEMTPEVSLSMDGMGVDVNPEGDLINDYNGLFDVGVNPYGTPG